MKKISLPYGNGYISGMVPREKLKGILLPRKVSSNADEQAIVLRALDNPIGTLPLRELAKGKRNIAIISSDHTRPVPSHITMPLLLQEIRKGNPNAKITIIIATGNHRAPSVEELTEKYGKDIVSQENIVSHDSTDTDNMSKVGVLPSGEDLYINRVAYEADLLVAEGFIEPHFFAGFSGGRKSILPGITDRSLILRNHCSENIANPRARTGVLAGNPVHEGMVSAAEMSGLDFILNVVLDEKKKIINAFCGHYERAHRKGCEFVEEIATVEAMPADIVITSNGGYPLDQNIYQAVKGMTAAEASCREGGVIIAVSQCIDGVGGDSFYRTFQGNSLPDIMDEINSRPREDTVPDQWQSQILARILLKHPVIMVSDVPKNIVEDLKMAWAPSIDDALLLAYSMLPGRSHSVTVIPDGVSVIVKNMS